MSNIKIEVLLFAQLRELTGVKQKTYDLPAGTLFSALLDRMTSDFGATFRTEVNDLHVIFPDRECLLREALTVPLTDNATIVFLPPIAGG
ncbi:MAG: MoaD/ThiS family protein [Chloroflexota bacterium]